MLVNNGKVKIHTYNGVIIRTLFMDNKSLFVRVQGKKRTLISKGNKSYIKINGKKFEVKRG